MACPVLAFQSSPVPEDGCNPPPCSRITSNWMFQSSPVPEDGCNAHGEVGDFIFWFVSILTRPGGRVQPNALRKLVVGTGFNPHPSRRTGAT